MRGAWILDTVNTGWYHSLVKLTDLRTIYSSSLSRRSSVSWPLKRVGHSFKVYLHYEGIEVKISNHHPMCKLRMKIDIKNHSNTTVSVD